MAENSSLSRSCAGQSGTAGQPHFALRLAPAPPNRLACPLSRSCALRAALPSRMSDDSDHLAAVGIERVERAGARQTFEGALVDQPGIHPRGEIRQRS